MFLFYSNDIRGDFAWFSEEETRHCTQVLRKKQGQALQFTDGRGSWYEGMVDEIGKRQLRVKIMERKFGNDRADIQLHIAISPPKNLDRFEWFLEKATEIGIHRITPLHCFHSERTVVKPDRLTKILLAAMKQSLRTHLPQLNEMTDFKAFIKNIETPQEALRFIAHCQSPDLPLLKNNCAPGRNVILLIGPEGDFSPDEIKQAQEVGFQPISLGKARLRTETAGMAGCHIFNIINEL